jgi:hypothetical protein
MRSGGRRLNFRSAEADNLGSASLVTLFRIATNLISKAPRKIGASFPED